MKTLLTCTAVVLVLFAGMAARFEGRMESAPSPPVRPSTVTLRTEPDDCFICHDDDTMTMERDGKDISLYVSPAAYAASAHRGLDCVECHEGFDPDEEPHREDIQPVDCASCHAQAARALKGSGHAGDLSCSACHSEIHTARTAGSAQTCLACHDAAAAELKGSAHDASAAGATCFDCHTPHSAQAADADRCLACHGDAAFVQANIAQQDSSAVRAFEHSVHGAEVACSDCHGGHAIAAASSDRSTVARANVAATCATCHAEAAEVYASSEHGRALARGLESAPTCTDCHGEHGILKTTDADARMSRQHAVAACLKCHEDTPAVRQQMTHTGAFVASYRASVHGRQYAAGDPEAAICSDCHGGHQAMKASDPASKVHQFNLAATCGTCHTEMQAAFDRSIHGQALARGVTDAPTCTTCHGEHGIIEHDSTASPVAAVNVSEQVCSPCHNSYKLSAKYGFPSDRGASFGDSYHGLATKFGDAGVANCASCHGVHDILPSTDPASKVHKANLVATCGECHPGANANFTKGAVHVVRTPEGDRLLYWISSIYVFLIVAIVGTMALHNVLDWFRKLLDRQHARHAPQPLPLAPKTGLFLRMTVNERIQHAALASSFLLLTATGFMLKFPEAWWVEAIRSISGEGLFALRGLLHRVAAVVMIAASCYHLYYIAFVPRGRAFLRDIWVNGQDAKDLWQMLRYNLGLSKARPRFGRFNYIEKSEYWALIWGTIVMGATGVVLWFENTFMGLTSKLFIDVAETIHYFEAWLAFLAIVVWHFYYVIFNPDAYPLNLTFLTGMVTEEEMEREHPLELEALQETEGA